MLPLPETFEMYATFIWQPDKDISLNRNEISITSKTWYFLTKW